MPLRPDMETSDYLDILRRRKWYIVFSILLILFGAKRHRILLEYGIGFPQREA